MIEYIIQILFGVCNNPRNVDYYSFDKESEPSFLHRYIVYRYHGPAERKSCNWGMQMIDGCSIEFFLPHFQWYHLAYAKERSQFNCISK